MLYTVREPQRIIKPTDSEIAAAARLLERAIKIAGDKAIGGGSSPRARDVMARRCGAMTDRLAYIAEYVETTKLRP
jgi:hypothetical protein